MTSVICELLSIVPLETFIPHRLGSENVYIRSVCNQECREDIKSAIGYISKLKSELQTNKPLARLTAEGQDFELWNQFLTEAGAECKNIFLEVL